MPARWMQQYGWLSLLLILKLASPFFLIHPEYQLHRDEYLHLDLGRHLNWGYLSVQPLTGLCSALLLLVGAAEWMVRMLPSVLGAATMFFLYRMVRFLGGSSALGAVAAAVFLFSPLLRLNLLYQPNSFDLLWWTAAYYYLLRYLKNEHFPDFHRLLLIAVMGLYSKYNFLFWMAGAAPVLLLASGRKLLFSRWAWLGMFIAFGLLLPTFYWQYQHQWPLLRFAAALKSTQLTHLNRSVFLKEQVLLSMSMLPLAIAGVYACAIGFFGSRVRWLALHLPLVLLLYIWQQGKGYYAVGVYPAFMTLGAVFVHQRWPSLRWWKAAWLGITMVLFYLFLPIAFPVKSPFFLSEHNQRLRELGLLQWEDGQTHSLPQDFADMLGWKQLAALTDQAMDSLQASETLILTSNYGQAGAINYYTTRPGARAFTLHADHRNWISYQTAFSNLIRIHEKEDMDTEEMNKLKSLFREVRIIGRITHPLAREQGTVVVRCTGARIHLGELIRQESLTDLPF